MADAESFDVVVLGFDERVEPPEARLQQAFGIDRDTAERILMELPATVQRAVSRVRAEYFRRALVRIGAAVEVRDPAGEIMPLIPSPSFPPPAQAPAQVRAPAPDPARVASPAPATVATPDPGWGSPPAPATVATPDPGWGSPPPSGRGAALELDDHPAGNTMPEISNRGALRQAGAPGWGDLAPVDGVSATAIPQPPPSPAFSALEWPAPDGASTALTAGPTRAVNADWNSTFSSGPGVGPPTGDPGYVSPPSLDQLRGGSPQGWAPRVSPAWADLGGAEPPIGEAPLPLLDPAAVGAVAMPRERSDVWDPPPARPRVEGSAATVRLSQAPAGEPNPPRPRPPKARPAGQAARNAPGGPARARARSADTDALPRPPTMSDGPAPFDLPQHAVPRARQVNPRPAPPAAPPPSAVAPPTAAADREPIAAAPVERAPADDLGFWESIGDGCVLPMRGAGLNWLFAISAYSVVVSFFLLLASFVPFVGAVVAFFASTSVLAFTCDYYRLCMWVPASNEQAIASSPDFDPARFLNHYIKSGIHLMLFNVVSQLLVIAHVFSIVFFEGNMSEEVWVEIAMHPLTWLLVLFPLYYWPMGVALTALHHNFNAIWSVPAGLRAIARAPLEYTVIVAIGIFVFGVSFGALLLLFGAGLGIGGGLVGAMVGLPMALSHGIQGALMGHLLRTRPEVFDQ